MDSKEPRDHFKKQDARNKRLALLVIFVLALVLWVTHLGLNKHDRTIAAIEESVKSQNKLLESQEKILKQIKANQQQSKDNLEAIKASNVATHKDLLQFQAYMKCIHTQPFGSCEGQALQPNRAEQPQEPTQSEPQQQEQQTAPQQTQPAPTEKEQRKDDKEQQKQEKKNTSTQTEPEEEPTTADILLDPIGDIIGRL